MEHPTPSTQVPAAVWRTIEIANSMSGESDDEHSKTNNSTLHDNHKGDHSLNTELSLHAPNCEAFPGMASTSAFKMISNDNHKGDHIHSLNTSTSSTASSQQSSSVTSNSSASAVFDCFNNVGGGKQDYRYTTIDNFTCTKAFNNKSSGYQAIINTDICFSSAVDAFNNIGRDTQTLNDAKIYFVANSGNSNQRNTSDNWVPANNVFNNNGYQNFDGFRYKTREGNIDEPSDSGLSDK